MSKKNNHVYHHLGFTLVELLVSITVIGILAALLFPAFNMIRAKAWNTISKDLCIQTALAWDTVQIEQRRFPSEELIKACLPSSLTFTSDGDLGIVMNSEVSSLLNWWTPKHILPAKDKQDYEDFLQEKGLSLSSMDYWRDNLKWPNDMRIERTPEQKKCGIIGPWAKRTAMKLTKLSDLTGDASTKAIIEGASVRVILDTNGDGLIKPPMDNAFKLGSAALDADGNQLVLRKSAIAWIYTDVEKSKVLTSW